MGARRGGMTARSPTSRSGPSSRSTCRRASTSASCSARDTCSRSTSGTTTCPTTASPAARACASGLGDVTSIRIDTYVDYIPSPDNGEVENFNWGIQPGLSFMLGGQRGKVRDKDGDGVPDAADECKNTPAGRQGRRQGLHHQGRRRRRRARRRRPVQGHPGRRQGGRQGLLAAQGCRRDGVLDNVDQCHDTPAGDKVDAKGCSLPKDADGDGVHRRRGPVQGHAGRRQGGRQGLLAAQGCRRRRRERRQGSLPASRRPGSRWTRRAARCCSSRPRRP